MKKYIQIIILLLLVSNGSRAATISGKVYNAANSCSPASNTWVILEDQYHVWKDSVWTDSNGVYTATIPPAVYYYVNITVSTEGCQVMSTRTVGYVGHDIRQNITVCDTGTGVRVKVATSSSPYINDSTFVVYLIRRDVDPVTFDTSLTAVDSSYGVLLSNGDAFIETGCILNGTYLVKAALLSNSPYYASNLPTYHDSALNWNGADTLTYGELDGKSVVAVHLVGGSNPGGPGFIGGSVLAGANKSTAVGDPLIGRRLILINAATGKAIGQTYSDAAGKFQFPNLAYGSYEIFGDAAGKKNPVLSITLSATEPSVNNIVFEENNKKFEGHVSGVAVGRVNGLNGIRVFPNPVTDFINVQGISSIHGSKTIILSNVTGTEISRQIVTDDVRISMSALPAGIYVLKVQTDAGSTSIRIAK